MLVIMGEAHWAYGRPPPYLFFLTITFSLGFKLKLADTYFIAQQSEFLHKQSRLILKI